MTNQNNFLFFLGGVIIGSTLGILYAPETGKNTRAKLKYQLDRCRNELEKLINDLLEKDKSEMSDAKSKGTKVVSDTIERAQELITKVDELKDQIKSEE